MEDISNRLTEAEKRVRLASQAIANATIGADEHSYARMHIWLAIAALHEAAAWLQHNPPK